MSNPFTALLVQHARMGQDGLRPSRPGTPESGDEAQQRTSRAGSLQAAASGNKGNDVPVETLRVHVDASGSGAAADSTGSATPMSPVPTSHPAPSTPSPKALHSQPLRTPVQRADISEFDPFSSRPPEAPASATASAHVDELVTPAPNAASNAAAGAIQAISNVFRRQPAATSSTPSHSRSVSQAGSVRSGGDTNEGASDTAANTRGKEPSFDFQGFLAQLRQKSAEPVARYLKSFLTNFAKKPFTVNEQIKLIHDFLQFIQTKMLLVEPWKSASPAEFDNALEAMEKLVMNRLYPYTFTPQLQPPQPITTDDLERDAVFAQRVRLFGWVREKHLDVPEGEASQGFLGFAEQELLKINHYKAPRDKLICILNCCKVIFGLIRHTAGPDATSADAFVPILIFVVLRANPDNMLSNVEYITRFRSAEKLQGEAGYYLSSLSGAIAFIETMDASSLSNITQEEFENNVEAAIQQLPSDSPTDSLSSRLHAGPRLSSKETMSPFAATSPGEEPARPLSSLNPANFALDTKRFFQRTGNLAQEAVSKPLNAIGKIIEGMQQNEETGSESGGDGEDRWRSERETERSTPRDIGYQPRVRSPQPPYGQSPSNVNWQREATPESPSARRGRPSHLGVSPNYLGMDFSAPASGQVTPNPNGEMPDFSSLQLQSGIDLSQESHAQMRRANVHTLHQMFPALDEEVVEAVLEGCGDDLGAAIDRLLEM